MNKKISKNFTSTFAEAYSKVTRGWSFMRGNIH